MKMKTRIFALLLSAVMTVGLLAGCGKGETEEPRQETEETNTAAEENSEEEKNQANEGETRIVIDATGAEVEVPAHPKKIAIGAMVLPHMVYALQGNAENIYTMPPSAYSGWEISILKDLAPELEGVDTTIAGDDYSINVEAAAAAGVDLVLNWDTETDQAEQLRAVGIPVVLLSSAKDMEGLKSLISILGDALDCKDRADEILTWYEDTENYFASKSEEIAALSDEEKPRVLHFQKVPEMTIYAAGMNPGITELEGGQNITLPAEVSAPTMEEVLTYDPEIIFISNFDDVTPDDFYNNTLEGQDWSGVSAVKNHRVYKVPCGLYRWAPPNAFEKPLYMLWTASLTQPEIFSDIDIRSEVKEFCADYLEYELTEEQLDFILHAEMNE